MSDKRKEKWQIYALNGERIMDGGTAAVDWDNSPPEDRRCGVTVVWLYRRVPTGVEVLFQQRARTVDHFPDQWDASAGGHVNYEESHVQAARREAKEEIGVEISADELLYGFSTQRGRGIIHTYFCDWTNREPAFSFDDHEVQAVQWVALSRIEAFREQYVKATLAQDNNYFTLMKTWLAENASVEHALRRRTLKPRKVLK